MTWIVILIIISIGLSMIRAKIPAILLLIVLTGVLSFAIQRRPSLPDTNSLKKLELELLLDLSEMPDVALPWVGKIDSRNEFIFFDAKLRRLMIMSLDGQQKKFIGSFGEGPGEYQQVYDILISEDSILVLDSRYHIIEYDRQGGLERVSKLPFAGLKLLGRSGDRFYLVGRTVSEDAFFENEVVSWQEGEAPVKLFKMPSEVIRTRAFSADGKEMPGGGAITLSEPAFAFLGDKLAAAAGSRYVIRFFDLEGHETSTWKVEAPEPEFTGRIFSSFKKKAVAYAIRDMFNLPDGLAVIGNYYRDAQPRLDCFGRDGQLRSSWLIPLVFEPVDCRFWLDHRYLIYFSREEGCRVYRILSRL